MAEERADKFSAEGLGFERFEDEEDPLARGKEYGFEGGISTGSELPTRLSLLKSRYMFVRWVNACGSDGVTEVALALLYGMRIFGGWLAMHEPHARMTKTSIFTANFRSAA